jgi:hypothetical protein
MNKRKPFNKQKKEKTGISDLDVAKKMLKIFQSSVDRSLEFDLSFETVKSLLLFPSCFYTGKKFEEEGIFGRSFDRIDSNLGYVEGNVVACTVDINQKKANLSFDEIEVLYNKLSGILKEKDESCLEDQKFNVEKEETK